MTHQPTLAFIGAGRVASALAIRLSQQGYLISGIAARHQATATALAVQVNSQRIQPHQVEADLIFITTPDDAIVEVAQTLDHLPPTSAIVHTSGVHSLDVLSVLAPRPIGSLHPVYPFRPGTRLSGDEGMLIGIEASTPVLEQRLIEIASAIGGQPAVLKAGQKALYHAAAVIASNYLVTLFHISQQMMIESGIPSDLADAALLGLMGGALNNLQQLPPDEALTGPIARGDAATLQKHLDALQASDFRDLYQRLGRHTLSLAKQLSDAQRQHIEQLLQKA